MSNGLDNLNNRRKQRQGRQTPSPRHPRSDDASSQAEPAPQDAGVPAHGDTGMPAESETPAEAAPPTATAPSIEARAGTPARGQARTRPPSIEAYLTQEQMDWLWQVRAAAMARRQDQVGSAVVRLALDELAGRMSPEQIAERIAAQGLTPPPASGTTTRGRRR